MGKTNTNTFTPTHTVVANTSGYTGNLYGTSVIAPFQPFVEKKNRIFFHNNEELKKIADILFEIKGNKKNITNIQITQSGITYTETMSYEEFMNTIGKEVLLDKLEEKQ